MRRRMEENRPGMSIGMRGSEEKERGYWEEENRRV